MGRTPSGRPPKQQLRIIKGKHREIMRRIIAGESQRRISRELEISETRLSIIVNSPLFQREYKKLEAEVKKNFIQTQASVQERVELLQPKAIDVLENILTKQKVDNILVSLPLKQSTALEVLELGGNRKKNGANGNGDAMSDVVKLISEGFELAKAGISAARENNSGNKKSVNGEEELEGGVIINTSADDVTLEDEDENENELNEETSDSNTRTLPEAVSA